MIFPLNFLLKTFHLKLQGTKATFNPPKMVYVDLILQVLPLFSEIVSLKH